jgi:hypothetical protein
MDGGRGEALTRDKEMEEEMDKGKKEEDPINGGRPDQQDHGNNWKNYWVCVIFFARVVVSRI